MDSRIEALLQALINGSDPPSEPQSRVETYLYVLCKQGRGSGNNNIPINSIYLADTETDQLYMISIVNGKLTMTEVNS